VFEDRFHRMVGMMLAALARCRDRALSRAARLEALSLGREPTSDEHEERERWRQVEQMYDRAINDVHAAGVAVHYQGSGEPAAAGPAARVTKWRFPCRLCWGVVCFAYFS
jgi:hypothetical protein